MGNDKTIVDKSIETDVLVLGSGAAGCGAAISAKERGVQVTILDKGKLESSGNLGGGNDHFMAVLNTGPETDTIEALVNHVKGPLSGVTEKQIENAWAKSMPPVLKILKEVGVEFVQKEDGSLLRTVGFGQPGNWWINIRNGHVIKRQIAKKIRAMDIEVIDHIMVMKLLKDSDQIVGCVGFNVVDGSFYKIRAKTIVLAFGSVASRGWVNSTWNPYNGWFSPYNTGSHFVLPYEAGVKLLNLDILQFATLLPKGYGAPGMNGINSMGGKELNAMGERFMGKYDPMWENGPRIKQISGTYQELVNGMGPPFYMDMTHMNNEDVKHLQYVLMPGDKATYLDYCNQRGIDFSKKPLEVELSEISFSGLVYTRDNMETNVRGLFNGCLFGNFSGSMCGGYYAGFQAAETAKQMRSINHSRVENIEAEKKQIYRPMHNEKGISYKEVEKALNQVLNYYMGYQRNQKGMEEALNKLELIEIYGNRIKASDYRSLMRANETIELIKMAKLCVSATMNRKESGRANYRRTDYPDINPRLNKVLVMWQENQKVDFSWGV